MKTDDKKAFFKHANVQRKSRPAIGPLKVHVQGKAHIEDGERQMADELSRVLEQSKSVFTTPKADKRVDDPDIFEILRGDPTM